MDERGVLLCRLRNLAVAVCIVLTALSIRGSGPVWTVGRGEWGQLGDCARIYSPYPIGVTLPLPATAVSPGTTFTLALLDDGTVSAWGDNIYGQLGDGTTTGRAAPGPVTGLADIVKIHAGNSSAYAIDATGNLWAWGYNGHGRLGDGTTTNRLEPVQVTALSDVLQVSGGYTHGVALDASGTVWTWGSNFYGELGDGTTVGKTSPIAVPGLGPAVAVAANQWATFALLEDGTVWGWGYNVYGTLGDGTGISRSSPVQVIGPTDVVAIAQGYLSGLALTSSGEVWGWGTWLSGSTAAVITGLPPVTAIAAGDRCFFGIESDGTVWGWKNNGLGQLANGTTTQASHPVQAAALGKVDSLAVFSDTVGALKSDGSLWVWGANDAGQLGDGRTFGTLTPQPVCGSQAMAALSGGNYHTCALMEDGTVWTWGKNPHGQLGTGSSTPSSEAVRPGTLDQVAIISAGQNHSTAVRTDGTVWWWGGYLNAYAYVPTSKATLNDAVEASSGTDFSLVRKSDGTVWGWGNNGSGRLGDGTTTNRSTPVQVQGVTTAAGIAAGSAHGMALLQDGSVVAWGSNSNGQLGDGTTTGRLTPSPVLGLPGPVAAVRASGTCSFAILEDGSLWAWGRNGNGQLGDGTTSQRNSPVQVSGMDAGVAAVASSGSHTLALKDDGTVWAFGRNDDGELGDGTTTQRTTPVQVPLPESASSVAAGYGFSAFVLEACAMACTADVPAVGAPEVSLAFEGGVSASDCPGTATYDWDFGDGTAHGLDASVTHAYATSGSYGWLLTVTQGGQTCTRTGYVAVAACELTCYADVPNQAMEGLAVSFTGSASAGTYCGSGSPTFDWDFGDGSGHSSAQSPSHTYVSPGTFNWSLTVTAPGATCSQTGSILIEAACQILCSATVPAIGSTGTGVPFAASVTEDCGGAVTYDWDFGDGSGHGSAQSPSHTYVTAGTYTWTLTVAGSGTACSESGSITIVDPPVITSMNKVGSPFRINVMGSNLQDGIAVYINGSLWGDSSNKTLVKWKSASNIKIKKGAPLKAVVPKNTPTTFRFVNPDGGEATHSWQWP